MAMNGCRVVIENKSVAYEHIQRREREPPTQPKLYAYGNEEHRSHIRPQLMIPNFACLD